MDFVEILPFLYPLILLGGAAIGIYQYNLRNQKQEEQEYKERLENSLEDEFIIDPESGAKLTLEQAEAGHWVAHDNKGRKRSPEELERIADEDQREFEILLNKIKSSADFTLVDHPEGLTQVLEKAYLWKAFKSWSFSHSFLHISGAFRVDITRPIVESNGYYGQDYYENQFLLILAIESQPKHYYFRKKNVVESLLDIVKPDDSVDFQNMECFPILPAVNLGGVQETLDALPNLRHMPVEVELIDKWLLIKVNRSAKEQDFVDLVYAASVAHQALQGNHKKTE